MENKKPQLRSLTDERRDYERAQARKNLYIGIAIIISTTICVILLTVGNANETIISSAVVTGSTVGSSLICSFFRQKNKEKLYKEIDEAIGRKKRNDDADTEESSE